MLADLAGSTLAGVRVGNDVDRGMAHVEGGGLPVEPFRSDLKRYVGTAMSPRPAVAKVAEGG